MCNETGIPELLESRILAIAVVVIVTSRTRAPYPYIGVTCDSNSEEPSRVHYAK